MSELPQRLRLTSFPCCQEAADRIEALEAEVSRRDLLLDNQAQRVKALEAALREIETAPVRFDDGSLGKIDVPYGRGIIKGLESSAEIARAALAPEQGK